MAGIGSYGKKPKGSRGYKMKDGPLKMYTKSPMKMTPVGANPEMPITGPMNPDDTLESPMNFGILGRGKRRRKRAAKASKAIAASKAGAASKAIAASRAGVASKAGAAKGKSMTSRLVSAAGKLSPAARAAKASKAASKSTPAPRKRRRRSLLGKLTGAIRKVGGAVHKVSKKPMKAASKVARKTVGKAVKVASKQLRKPMGAFGSIGRPARKPAKKPVGQGVGQAVRKPLRKPKPSARQMDSVRKRPTPSLRKPTRVGVAMSRPAARKARTFSGSLRRSR